MRELGSPALPSADKGGSQTPGKGIERRLRGMAGPVSLKLK